MKIFLKKLLPDFILYWYHWKLALLGALVYGFPSRKLKVIGVTGTKGKSTVVVLAGRVLQKRITPSQSPPYQGGEEILNFSQPPLTKGGEIQNPPQPSFTKGGSKVGWISSLTINDGKNEVMNPHHMTMPVRFFIQKTLRQMVKNGCEYALVEVTSEGVKQFRHKFIDWTGAVFTNLAAEHLEAHGGFAKYRLAKEQLFAAAAKNKNGFGVYNLDDKNVGEFLKYSINKKYGYCFSNPSQPPLNLRGGEISPLKLRGGEGELFRLQISNVKLDAMGSEFEINNVQFKTNLLGEFNVYNCAAAAAIGMACGVGLETASQVLAEIQSIPGRLEIINEGQDFTVVVDLAHTPDSFEKVFRLFGDLKNQQPTPSSTEEERKKSKIISVFGSAGGGRDKWKRPELGGIASENSDIIIITNEDPYDENPQTIADEIAAGCKTLSQSSPSEGGEKAGVEIILDRRAAIASALSLAQKDDIVLILGKGTEQTMVMGGKKHDWDDRIVVREEIKKLRSSL